MKDNNLRLFEVRVNFQCETFLLQHKGTEYWIVCFFLFNREKHNHFLVPDSGIYIGFTTSDVLPKL